MAKQRKYNRRRRGRFTFLYKMLAVLVICLAVVLAMTLFFRVDSIRITGGDRYKEQEIVAAAGVETGDNLFLLNKYAIAEDLLKKLPYISQVRINRELPDTLTIDVTETHAAVQAAQDGSVWLISPEGKIVEQRAASAAGELIRLEGCQLLAPTVSSYLALATDRAIQQQSLLDLLGALETSGLLEQVEAIYLSDLSLLTMDFAQRFTVELPYGADYDYKLKALQTVLDSGRIESNETGTIRMTAEDGSVMFIKD